MNPDVTTEILRLKREIARANEWVGELGKQVDRLEARARQEEPEATAVSPAVVEPARPAPAPPPLPKRSTTPVWRPSASLKPSPVFNSASTPAEPSPVSPQPQPAMPPKSGDSMEWRLGSYWLVRIGIVILLTGVVFLGNFVWKTYLPHLGHWGKLSFIALGAGALVVAGGRLERRKPDLQGYGRVLTAGGLALGYYTAYAAHFVERLRVITSPVFGGVVLLAAAFGITAYADRRRSQGAAMLTVLLAFYTAAMNPIAEFSLFSNALLCGVAVYLLRRHQWGGLTWISMAASYGAFGFWRYYQTGVLVWGTGLTPGEFWTSRAFLLTYWLLLSHAFLRPGPAFPPERRALGLATNNAAFFAYTAPAFYLLYPDHYWIFPLVFGAVTLGLTALAARRHPGATVLDGSLLFQSLAFLVLGLGARLHGWPLSLSLGLMGALLLRSAPARLMRIAMGCALGIAVTAFLLALPIRASDPASGWNALFLAAVFFGHAGILHRRFGTHVLRPTGVILAFLGLMTFCALLALTATNILGGAEWAGVILAFAGAGWMILCTRTTARELLPISQVWLLCGGLTALVRMPMDLPVHPGWMAAAFAAAAGIWRVGFSSLAAARRMGEAICSLIAILWLHALLRPYFNDAEWTTFATLASLAFYAVSVVLRAPGVFAGAFIFQLSGAFALAAAGTSAETAPCLLLGAAAFALLRVANCFTDVLSDSDQAGAPDTATSAWRLLQAVLLCLLWAAGLAFTGIPSTWVFGALLLASAVSVFGLRDPLPRRLAAVWFGALATLQCLQTLAAGDPLPGFNAAGLLLVMAMERSATRTLPAAARPWLQGLAGLITAGWIAHVHSWMQRAEASTTVGWAVLAALLLAYGFAVKAQRWRIAGLACFVLALIRIFTLDVWKLDSLGRIASFIILGLALLGVGFLYNLYRDRIREWTRGDDAR